MARKYPNAYIELDVFMNELLEAWNNTFGVKKNRARAANAINKETKAPYILEKVVIFPTSIKKNRKPKKIIGEKTQNLLILIYGQKMATDTTPRTAAFSWIISN